MTKGNTLELPETSKQMYARHLSTPNLPPISPDTAEYKQRQKDKEEIDTALVASLVEQEK